MPRGRRKRELPEAVLVHCNDVYVLLERLCGEKKLELESVYCGKKVSFLNTIYTRHHPNFWLMFIRIELAEGLFRKLSARPLNRIIIFRRVGPLVSSMSCRICS